MFTSEHRDHVRHCILELARADQRVTAGALTGSTAFGAGDDWSDIDVAFGIADGNTPEVVLQDWTQVLDQEFSVLDHFDLRSGSSIYRVFLLPSGLEVDMAVTPGKEFGARGPHFRALFGTTHQLEATPQPSARHLIGLGWHHVLHARSCIERNKPWQAEYWISAARDYALSLACHHRGLNTSHGRGFDDLPGEVLESFTETLVCSLDREGLLQALGRTIDALLHNSQDVYDLASKLEGRLHELNSTILT